MTHERIRQLGQACGIAVLIIGVGFVLGDLIGQASAHGLVLGSIVAIAIAPWSMMAVVRR
jgi:hypothetical protein